MYDKNGSLIQTHKSELIKRNLRATSQSHMDISNPDVIAKIDDAIMKDQPDVLESMKLSAQ